MEQVLLILNSKEISYIFFLFLFFLLGWLLKKIYSQFIFLFLKIFGRLGEKKARMLLKKNGYEIVEEQVTLKGKFLENKKMKSFFIKPDFLVKKKNEIFIAEAKTGKSASTQNRHTRRQLLEYASNYRSKKVLLIDVDKNSIKEVEFL